MKYKKFNIKAYKAIIESSVSVDQTPVPIIGVNESGKSSILEAIAYFDYRNDNLAADKKWKFLNRYTPEATKFSVECEIEITQEELDAIRTPHLLPVLESTIVEEVVPTDDIVEPIATVPQTVEEADIVTIDPLRIDPIEDELKDITIDRDSIIVTRSFSTQEESKPYSINGIESTRVDELARSILKQLARIYYFDNFLERPLPDQISFSKSYIDGTSNDLNEDQSIIEGAFSDTGVDLREFFNNKDADAQSTLMSRVNDNVTKKIIDDWRKMHIPEGEIDHDLDKYANVKIMLRLGDTKKSISVKIIEKFPDYPEVTMNLSERSLGFRWFFNFSARKCFAGIHDEKFLYLIDEPGSYLHNSAQTVLLDALIVLAEKHPVIYSTHSEFLLDPEKININRTKVVQKEDHAVRLLSLSNTTTKKHEGALSTLYNSLRMRTPLETVMNKKVIVTEGITDFYFWKPIFDVAFLPGFGAGNNKYLISMAIGASKKYIALFDGDTAGNDAKKLYQKIFNINESNNWLTYIDNSSSPKVLESLLSKADTKRIKSITDKNDIKQAITFLFFDCANVDEFWNGIDDETRKNIQSNVDRISVSLGLTKANIKYGFNTSIKI